MSRRDSEFATVERLYSIGQHDGAIESLKRLLSEDPDDAEAHAWLAACLLRKRRLYAAGIEAGMAVTLAPDSIFARWIDAELALAKRDLVRAGQHVDWLLATAPESAEFHLLRARWMQLSGKGRETLPVLEQALACDPDNAETLAALSAFHCDAGSLEQAEQYALAALKSAPESTSALVARGHVCLQRGDVQAARELALDALRFDPEDVGALALLTAVKARSSVWLGLWWRYASWTARVGPTHSVIVLLVAFVLYRVASIATADAGATGASGIIDIAWIAVVIYSWVGPTLFHRALRKELDSVRIGRF